MSTLFSNRLVRELAVVMVIKLAFLFALRAAFFSADDQVVVDQQLIDETLLGSQRQEKLEVP